MGLGASCCVINRAVFVGAHSPAMAACLATHVLQTNSYRGQVRVEAVIDSVLLAWDPRSSCQWYPSHSCRFHGQGHQILGIEVVQV
jgi:hypothetical protein